MSNVRALEEVLQLRTDVDCTLVLVGFIDLAIGREGDGRCLSLGLPFGDRVAS